MRLCRVKKLSLLHSILDSKDDYKGNNKRLALLIPIDCLNLCEDVLDLDFFSVVIDDFDQIAIKRVVKKLEGKFNVGLTHRSFYVCRLGASPLE